MSSSRLDGQATSGALVVRTEIASTQARDLMVQPPSSAQTKSGLTGNPDALSPGTRLEEFEIERVLSDSGVTVVYLARDHALDLTVALKEYLPATLAVRSALGQLELREPSHGAAFERGRLAFISEARVLARCDHGSLLRVHRVWEANDTVYRVMPYYPGQSLLDVRRGMSEPPDETSLRALLDALLGALETLHNAGHVHGDVSPANILLLPDDRPVLMDFGAVRRAIFSDRIEDLMAALGPPSRAATSAESPGDTPGTWSDLRALAAVAQFCISGEPTTLAPSPHRLPERAASLQYSKSLLDALESMRATQPNDALHTAAQFRSLLQGHAVHDSGRIDPILNPVLPATPDASGAFVPELMQDNFVAKLNQAIAATAHQAKLQHSAASTRVPGSAVKVRPQSRGYLARAASWGGAALVALAFGAAGWKLSEHMAGTNAPGTLAGMAGHDTPVAALPVGTSVDRSVAAVDARPSPSIPQEDTHAPASMDRPRDTTKEARTPVAVGDAAAGVVVMGAAGASERIARPGRPVVAKPAPELRPAARASGSPREVCGERTQFALYRCMQMECADPRWSAHAQCVRLRTHDEVD